MLILLVNGWGCDGKLSLSGPLLALD
jgi:hypothetical protein